MVPIYIASELAAAPADRSVPTRTGSKAAMFFEVANLTPYVFELIGDDNQVYAVVGPFGYAAVSLAVGTDHLTFHVIATEAVASQPFVAANWQVLGGLTAHPTHYEKLA